MGKNAQLTGTGNRPLVWMRNANSVLHVFWYLSKIITCHLFNRMLIPASFKNFFTSFFPPFLQAPDATFKAVLGVNFRENFPA